MKKHIETLIQNNWTTIYSDEWLKWNPWQQCIDDVEVNVEGKHITISFCGCRKEWFIKALNKNEAKETLKIVFGSLGKMTNLKIKSNTIKPNWMNYTYQAITHIEFDLN